jgi:uncharacterized protein YndB with AHSA1/START domain
MTVKSVQKDPKALTMTVTAELDATVERAWQLWADPRQLERWWGPPGYPATFTDHDFNPGGRVAYFMTSPEGDKYGGWWEVVAVEPPRRLEFRDGFADHSGKPNESMPVTNSVVTLTGRSGGGTVLTIESRFPSLEAMEKLAEMGMEEGLTAAMNQMDAILATPVNAA